MHDAVGHVLEGDFNRKGSSVFSNKIGQAVTSRLCTIVDDSILPGRRGSLRSFAWANINKKWVLGKLRLFTHAADDKYLYVSWLIRLYKHCFISRLGIYAPNFFGGQVDITSGKFVFTTSKTYLIEKSKIIKPVKGDNLN